MDDDESERLAEIERQKLDEARAKLTDKQKQLLQNRCDMLREEVAYAVKYEIALAGAILEDRGVYLRTDMSSVENRARAEARSKEAKDEHEAKAAELAQTDKLRDDQQAKMVDQWLAETQAYRQKAERATQLSLGLASSFKNEPQQTTAPAQEATPSHELIKPSEILAAKQAARDHRTQYEAMHSGHSLGGSYKFDPAGERAAIGDDRAVPIDHLEANSGRREPNADEAALQRAGQRPFGNPAMIAQATDQSRLQRQNGRYNDLKTPLTSDEIQDRFDNPALMARYDTQVRRLDQERAYRADPIKASGRGDVPTEKQAEVKTALKKAEKEIFATRDIGERHRDNDRDRGRGPTGRGGRKF